MNDIKTSTMIGQANELLGSAAEELCRPAEDVVPYLVCSHAYKAVKKYLAGFLRQNGIELHNSLPLDQLQKLCRDIDPRFASLDFGPMLQSAEDEKIWTNMGTATRFMEIATATRNLVTQ